MVRKQVQSRLGVDVSHRKAFIKEQVCACSLPLPFKREPFKLFRSSASLEAPRWAFGQSQQQPEGAQTVLQYDICWVCTCRVCPMERSQKLPA